MTAAAISGNACVVLGVGPSPEVAKLLASAGPPPPPTAQGMHSTSGTMASQVFVFRFGAAAHTWSASGLRGVANGPEGLERNPTQSPVTSSTMSMPLLWIVDSMPARLYPACGEASVANRIFPFRPLALAKLPTTSFDAASSASAEDSGQSLPPPAERPFTTFWIAVKSLEMISLFTWSSKLTTSISGC